MILEFRSRQGLTRREIDVLRLVADGRSNKQIARELCVIDQCVKNHLHNAMLKLGAGNRVEAILLAHVAGIVDLPESAARFAARLEQQSAA